MRKLFTVIMMFLVTTAFSVNATANDEILILDGIDSKKIRITRDGAGLIRNVECDRCVERVVTLVIDDKTQLVINNEVVDSVEVNRRHKNATAGVQFNANTKKVLKIRW